MLNSQKLPATWFKLVVLGLLIFSVGCRFGNLAHKVYWHDEVYTSLRITAHTRGELVSQAFTGRVLSPQDLQHYQQFAPHRTLLQSLQFLGQEDAQHPPLYFIVLRLWAQGWGHSIWVIRCLSVLMSLLMFPALYWLCQELFAEALTAWIAIALVAVSPLDLLFAQEAREYILWVVMILLSSAALLQALRLQTVTSWGLYALTLVLGLYTFLFTALVMLSHGLYVWLLEGCCWTQRWSAYLLAAVGASVAFVPWLFYVVTGLENIQRTTHWLSDRLSLGDLLHYWVLNASRIFIDGNVGLNNPWEWFLVLAVIGMEGYALLVLGRHAPPQTSLFVFTLIGVSAIALVVPDLLGGGQRSIITRYLFPIFLGLQLSVAFLISHLCTTNPLRGKRWGEAVFFALIVAGVISCGLATQAETWWNKSVSADNPAIAQILNQANHPLLISDAYGINPGNLISLSYQLHPHVLLLLLPEVSSKPMIPALPRGVQEIFLLNLPAPFRTQLATQYQRRLTPVIGDLWQLSP